MALTNKSGFFAQHRWLLWAIGIALAVVVLASFISRDEVVPVRVAGVQRDTIRSVVSTNGKIEPLQNFEAHTPVGTSVKKVLVREGDHVKKGQVLVQLDDAEARSQAARALAQVRTAQANLNAIVSGGNREEVLTNQAELTKARAERDAAQRNLEALRRLQQSAAASEGEVKAAQNQLARAEADVKLLEEKLRNRYSQAEVARVEAQKAEAEAAYAAATDVLTQLNIRAPFGGVVYSLPVRQGDYVNPGDLVVQVADLSKVVVRAFVDEPDVGRLVPGQKIEVTWDAVPGRIWTGTVTTIPAAVKLRGSRNVGETSCTVENGDSTLLPNINVGVTIVTAEHRDVLTVPREAIRQSDGKTFVFEVVNNELKRREVQTSVSNLTTVEVTTGVQERNLVALNSTNSKPLRNGLPVKVVR